MSRVPAVYGSFVTIRLPHSFDLVPSEQLQVPRDRPIAQKHDLQQERVFLELLLLSQARHCRESNIFQSNIFQCRYGEEKTLNPGVRSAVASPQIASVSGPCSWEAKVYEEIV